MKKKIMFSERKCKENYGTSMKHKELCEKPTVALTFRI